MTHTSGKNYLQHSTSCSDRVASDCKTPLAARSPTYTKEDFENEGRKNKLSRSALFECDTSHAYSERNVPQSSNITSVTV